ncbi:unnamed protein product [Phytophthora lilii]|uniref:Unnamed protein product n=1 Tax=Phytophthora lilii TaxID=2077276 RepID=A0A9W6TDU5_9STRA|nr:unnamed protein product [Phytophthora lilii]
MAGMLWAWDVSGVGATHTPRRSLFCHKSEECDCADRCCYRLSSMGNCYSNEDQGEPCDAIIHKSPHHDIAIPDITMWEVAENQAKINGDKPAFVCGLTHEVITFGDLFVRANRLAAALQNDGVGKGTVVLLHSFNCVEYPIVVLACTGLGAVCSPSSPMFLANELSRQISTSKAKFVVVHKQLENVAFEAASNAGLTGESIYTIGSTKAETKHHFKNVKYVNLLGSFKGREDINLRIRFVSEIVLEDKWTFEYKRVDPKSRAMLPFSSGTTGVPKGVALSARNMVANVLQVDHIEDLGHHCLGLLPFFHIYGTMTINLVIYQGEAMVVLPRFKPESFLGALSNPLVEKYDLSSTEFLVSGGAPLGKELTTLVETRRGIKIKQAHGMTELSPIANYGENNLRKAVRELFCLAIPSVRSARSLTLDYIFVQGSVGRLPPNTELRVVSLTTGKDLPANEHGELLYRGPQVMMGYFENLEATNKIMTKNGFLRTGDIGYIDEDGFVFVVDRAKELIKYKGHGVAPAELEDILNHHPDIVDSCCVRGQDAKGEEIPKAFVVLKHPSDPSAPTADEIMAYVAEQVAPYKKIREVEFIDAIPKNASGKLLRRKLQELEALSQAAGVAA